MRIVLVLKPYAIEVYSYDQAAHTLVGVEEATRIDGESTIDYEKRMIYICKELCTDMRSSAFFKDNAKKLEAIDVVLSAPWCTYDVIHVEKTFEKPVKVDQELIASMRIRKEDKDVRIVESYTSHMLLNGYSVQSAKGQLAQSVQFQHVHVYASSTFALPLMQMLENIFHTHKVSLISLYGLVEKMAALEEKAHTHELRIILEEESVDVSYISQGVHVVNIFVPHSYTQLEEKIAVQLSATHNVVAEILKSRREAGKKNHDKNAKRLWPDLDVDTKKLVDTAITESIEQVLKSIRDCIDTISGEYTKDFVTVRVFCLHKRLADAYGYQLADTIKDDAYIALKIHMVAETITVQSVF